MRTWPLAALLLLVAGCGAYQFPGDSPSPSPSTGTVSGRVIAVPCSPIEPVQPAGSTCAGRPVPDLELDYLTGSTVTKAVTDSRGDYEVELKPGSYAVKMKTYMRVISGALNITVASGSSSTVNYVLDSGIRQPVPQQ